MRFLHGFSYDVAEALLTLKVKDYEVRWACPQFLYQPTGMEAMATFAHFLLVHAKFYRYHSLDFRFERYSLEGITVPVQDVKQTQKFQ